VANLATTLEALGDLKAAIQADERAIRIYRQVYDGDHVVLANALSNLAWNLYSANAFTESDAVHRESVAMFERTVGPDSPRLAWALNNYGLLFWRQGNNDAALPLFERALAIWTRAKSADASRALNNLAITTRRLGDFAAARSYYERSLAIKEKTLHPDHTEVALVVYNLANLLREMGDSAAARPMYERALRIREKALGPGHSLTAYALNGLGQVLMDLQEPARARPLVARAVQIWREREAPDVAVGLSTLADIAYRSGNLTRALAYYDESRAVYEKTFGPDYVDVASVLTNAAAVAKKRGDLEDARQRYSRALAIFERRFDDGHPAIAEITAGLAQVEWQLGDVQDALALALRSERISREHFRLTSRTLSEREAVMFAEKRAPALDVLLTLAVAGGLGPDDLRRIMDAAVRSRALVLDEVTARGRATVAGANRELADAVTRARQRLANLIVRGARPGETGYATLVNGARADRDAAERALAAANITQRDRLAREQAGLGEVTEALEDGDALVTFVAYEHLVKGPPPAKDERRYAALVARARSQAIVVVPIGTVLSIDAHVSRWRQAVATFHSRPAQEQAYRRTADALSAAIWQPIGRHVRDVRRLFVVPDGAINLVSFAALPDAPNRYVVESGPLVHYLSAERDLIAPPRVNQSAAGMLVLGDPAYTLAGRQMVAQGRRSGSGAACPEFSQIRFDRLSATVQEIAEIGAMWVAQAAGTLQQLSGDAATESAFKRAASQQRILHLATHGFFLGSCEQPDATMRGVGGLASQARHKNRIQPLVPLSGLALAGANHRAGAGSETDDGILTAEEVVGLDLHEVEWAVLSACDTGVGEVRAGEGVFGLRRAFTAAGVRTTIMSLWSVEDRSTREWMTALYRARLLDRKSTVEAVTEASRGVLRSRRSRGASTHPFYWAAFVAAGDWR
jgi:CHAT domain-containing protein/Tfp pilus assembly protein PilF